MSARSGLALGVLVVLAMASGVARAQEFAAPLPHAVAFRASTMLDLALPSERAALELQSAVARPFGLAELDAGHAIVGGGWRSMRAAAGIARHGEAELGWHALGGAIGFAGEAGGIALRSAVRRDRSPGLLSAESAHALTRPAVGGEIGAGAWIALARGGRAWVAHPQIATRGASPPLRRALEAGIVWSEAPVRLWLVREAPPRGHAIDAHRAGLALGVTNAWIWSELFDAPLRASVGVAARSGAISVGAAIDMHPVLAPSTRLALGVGGVAW